MAGLKLLLLLGGSQCWRPSETDPGSAAAADFREELSQQLLFHVLLLELELELSGFLTEDSRLYKDFCRDVDSQIWQAGSPYMVRAVLVQPGPHTCAAPLSAHFVRRESSVRVRSSGRSGDCWLSAGLQPVSGGQPAQTAAMTGNNRHASQRYVTWSCSSDVITSSDLIWVFSCQTDQALMKNTQLQKHSVKVLHM